MVRDYAWVKPIHFQPQTVQWLNTVEWPSTLADDLEKIAKHNDKCKALGLDK